MCNQCNQHNAPAQAAVSPEATVVDTRGLSCPEPVWRTKQALDAGKLPVIALADSEAAKENITLLVKRLGYHLTVEKTPEGEYKLTITA